jgi:hypothetical protein
VRAGFLKFCESMTFACSKSRNFGIGSILFIAGSFVHTYFEIKK